MKTLLFVIAALLCVGSAHAASESTKKYCVEYNNQKVTVTGNVFVRTLKYDDPNDSPPEARETGKVSFPLLVLDQPMCTYGIGPDADEEEVLVWALHFLDVGNCYLRKWSGNHVKVTGTVYHASNWHHHTLVLFHTEKIEGFGGKLPACVVYSR